MSLGEKSIYVSISVFFMENHPFYTHLTDNNVSTSCSYLQHNWNLDVHTKQLIRPFLQYVIFENLISLRILANLFCCSPGLLVSALLLIQRLICLYFQLLQCILLLISLVESCSLSSTKSSPVRPIINYIRFARYFT